MDYSGLARHFVGGAYDAGYAAAMREAALIVQAMGYEELAVLFTEKAEQETGWPGDA